MSNSEELVLWEGKPAGISDRLKEKAKLGILNNTTYKITTQRIIIESGLIGKNIEEVELLRVRDLSVKQSLKDKLIGVGSVTVFSDDISNSSVIFEDIQDAHKVKDIIRKAVREEKSAHNISYRENL
ncbi:PH domain-containing protein [Paenibacillus sp. FSL R5-0887]|uniref:YdbS-like PH domain-containing protein n=1 Tax=Paenibacillus odorifer TaxID=189426 RepID=A0AB36J352_9BACL|nr:PH domain-containing protein [Paenibacillus odorifer]OMC99909.1 hypothetical protein BJP49_28760 [Paenibacillus odorifer]OME07064.1 hypothetical protein BSK60_31845 [Paenibacillus odorifer]OME09727.1 hypothetical protein BSK47_31845 [Paenibacillus odorifer]OME58256.1 hypothetical protein BSK59_08735 [Paenibacillus odorifer]